MKRIFLFAFLLISYVGAFAQAKELHQLLLNPSNSSGSNVKPDTTRETGNYYFESAKINAADMVSIYCYTKKDSGTVAGNVIIEASDDPATTNKTWAPLSIGDTLNLANGDNVKYWVFTPVTTYKAAFYWYRANLNLTAKSRSRVKCYIHVKQK